MIAVELEFYLIDRERDSVGAPQPPRSPATGERASQSQLYSVIELDEYADFLEDITLAAQAQRLRSIPRSRSAPRGSSRSTCCTMQTLCAPATRR